jgi:hypothetical protein
MSLKSALDKTGIGGLFLVAVCCLRIEAVFSLLLAIGLGFLTRATFLTPVMGTLLAVILTALVLDYRIHRRSSPLAIAIPGALALYFFVFIHRVNLAVYGALFVLILGRILNLIFMRRATRPSTGGDGEARSGIGLMAGQGRTGPAERRQTSGQ